MKSVIAVLLLAILAFAAAQQDNYVVSNLQTGETLPADSGETLGPTTFAAGYVTVVITATYSVEVCFQENFIAAGSLATNCNPEGYIAGAPSTVAETNKYSQDGTGGAKKRLLRRALEADTNYSYNTTLYLRDNTIYAVSARWTISDEDDAANQTGSVNIQVTYSTCPAGNSGYGINCDIQPVVVASGVASTGVLAANTTKLFSFNIPQGMLYNSVIFNVQYSTPTTFRLARRDISGSPIQIYARRDAYPVTTSSGTVLFDESTSNTTSSTTNSTSLTFSGPEQGTWLVLLETSSTSFGYNLTVQTVACPTAGEFPNVNDNNCSAPVTIDTFGSVYSNTSIPANGSLFEFPSYTGGIQYFVYETEWLLVGVVGSNQGATGAPGVYASATSIPSAASSEVESAESAQVNFLNVRSIGDQAISWIVAVQPLADSDPGFKIWAGFGCAQNCTGRGTCAPDNGADGVCTCNSGYKDFACTTQKLKTIYIVLIAIGGAIVLAIAIGVPVGCYIKNRKRARYERV